MNTARMANASAAARFIWPLFLGLGLAIGLIWVLPDHSAAKSQDLNAGFTLDLAYDAIWGRLSPGAVVTLTRPADGAYGAAQTDGVGFYWTPLWLPSGRAADLAAGDTIEIYINGALDTAVTPKAISGQVDVLNDRVMGNVAGLSAGTAVTVTLGDFGTMVSAVPQVVATVDGSGDFNADFSGMVDIGPHQMAQVQYFDASGAIVQTYAYPEAVLSVQDWSAAMGYAHPGTVLTATVYSSYPGSVRWSDSTTPPPPHGAYRVEGEIEYGDVVEVNLGEGTVVSVTADYMEMRPDAALDQITGVAPAGSSVRGYVWDSADGNYDEDTMVASVGGDFVLNLSAGLDTQHYPYVAYADSEGDEVGYMASPPHIRAYPPLGFVSAVADQPNQPVTYTLDTGSSISTVTAQCGKANSCDSVPFESLAAGHTVTVQLPSRTMTMTVASISIVPDTANDRVIGEVDIPGWVNVYPNQWQNQHYPIHGNAVARVAAAPPSYAVPFEGFDIRDGMGLIWVAHYAASNGHRTFAMLDQDRLAHFQVEPPWDVTGVPVNAEETVTATLYTSDGVELAASSTDDDADPWRFRLSFHGEQEIAPGQWVTITSESGWTAGLQVPELTTRADADADLIWGKGPESLLYVKYDHSAGWNDLLVPSDGYVVDTAFLDHDLQYGNWIETTYQAPNGNRVSQWVVWPEMRVLYDDNTVNSDYPAGHTFWITVTDSLGTLKATATAMSEVGGGMFGQDGFETYGGQWSPPNPDLQPGDWVTFQSDDGYDTAVQIGSVRAHLNTENDSVSGVVYAPWFTQTLQGMVRNFQWWGMGGLDFTAEPDGGAFSVDVAPHDIIAGTRLTLQYEEPDHDWVIRDYEAYEPSQLGFDIGVNYDGDWVNGHCEAGHTIWITATASDGHTIEATGIVTSAVVPGWDGGTGFEGNSVDWSPEWPDIDPGDWVFAMADSGETRSVQVGTITGRADARNDTLQGTVDIEGIEDVVRVTCAGWSGAPGDVPRKEVLVLPNGVDQFSCAWDPDTEWDLEADQVVGVWYNEADGDYVLDGDAIFSSFPVEEQLGVFLPLVLASH
jgi:hypothetical protein